MPWYVYDRHANLLQVADTLRDAETWAVAHWGVVEVAGREQVDDHDFWYLLLTAADASKFRTRDHQARIMRQDRVVQVGRDPAATPRERH